MVKTFTMRLKPDTHAALYKAAKAEGDRSITSLISRILTDWLRERGYLS